MRIQKSQTSSSNYHSTAVTGVSFRGRQMCNLSTGSSSFSTMGVAGNSSSSVGVDRYDEDDLIKFSMQSSVSLLDQTLWTEVEYLNEVTNRLRQRLFDIKHGVSDVKATPTANTTKTNTTTTNAKVISKPPPPTAPRSLSHSPATKLVGSPVNKKRQEKQLKPKENERDEKLTKASNLSEETPPPMRNNEDSILTSLSSFQYKLASNEQTPKVKHKVKKDIMTTDKGHKGEKHDDDSSKVGTPICYATADDSSGITSKAINDSPLVVELLNSSERNIMIVKEAAMNDETSQKSSKLTLLRGRVMSVKQELNSHVSSLLALQRDALDAQKRGLMNSEDPFIKALRLNIRDELNACSTRMPTMATLRNKLHS
ncbi:hypothetical protein LSM04_000070 [Trypanosoma melophagium]|uniref:uncharacterized protein n=1 Tax=Trypanosoma melophagium TaxID=715481 RepID=UPI00351A65E0|nr:hypothetical protein LSM04_000070 [Trypanosoma melophagium]